MTASVLILVEGQTEEAFVRSILGPHLTQFGCHTVPVLLETSRNPTGGKRGGGVSNWPHIRRDLQKLCRNPSATISTMLDLYGLPADTPGHDRVFADPRDLVRMIERSVDAALESNNLRTYIQLHEFEAFLFVDPTVTASAAGRSSAAVAKTVADAIRIAGEPELVNDGPQTAPSRRIMASWQGFSKPVDGLKIVSQLGLNRLRLACPHFGEWLTWLESLGTD
jgi:Domain of unknown function (DUF4276)